MDAKRHHKTDSGHLTQSTRALRALDTDYFRPDERTLAQLINTATGLSRLITYFDDKDKAHHPSATRDKIGAWEAFFRDDVTFLLAEIAAVDIRAEFRASRAAGTELKPLIVAQATRLWNWHRRARDLAVFAGSASIEAALFSTLDQPQESDLKGLVPRSLMLEIRRHDDDVPACWQASSNSEHRPAAVFSTFTRVTAQIGNAAEKYLERSLTDKSNHGAHVGLFLAFVRLLQKSQVELNKITDRHLEFYFRKVLRSNPRDAQPDHTHIIFELSPGARPEILPAGTTLVAGGGSGFDAIIFETERPLLVTSARAQAFKAVAIDRDPNVRDPSGTCFVERVSAYPKANSADGKGAPLPDPANGWNPFGPETADPALVGLAISAPVLNLAGGIRAVELTLHFDDQNRVTLPEALARYRTDIERRYEGDLTEKRFDRFLNSAFRLSLTTAAGFHPVTGFTVDPSGAGNHKLVFSFTLPADAPSIAAWAAVHDQPLLKIELDPDARAYAYSAFHKAMLTRAEVSISVQGLAAGKIMANGAPVKPGKPFAPFGLAALPGADMILHVQELADKRVESLGLQMVWTGLPVPPADLASYYADYGAEIANDSFRASLSNGDGKIWRPLQINGPGDTAPGPDAALFPLKVAAPFSVCQWDTADIPKAQQAGTSQSGSVPEVSPDNIRVVLTNPEMGFGTQIYPRLVTKAAISNAEGTLKKAVTLLSKFQSKKKPKPKKTVKPPATALPSAPKVPGNATIPNPPLQPMLSDLTISYTAAVSADIPGTSEPIKLMKVGLFGGLFEAEDGQFIQSNLNIDGRLMIGLDRITPPEPLTLFFNIQDSRAAGWANGDTALRPSIHWSYFSNTGWRRLPKVSIIADGTEELTTHGVVEIALPEDLKLTTRYSKTPLAWLSIGYQGDRARFGKVIEITTQSVDVRRRPPESTQSVPASLPAGSITRFFKARPAITSITQPLASEGGGQRESTRMHRTRLSERLGHKMRAIRQMDYARMVLEAFPDIADAKCRHLEAGSVELIVSPRRSMEKIQCRPRVALHVRSKIARWLSGHTALSLDKVSVRNPAYEDIRVQAHLVPQGAGTFVTLAQVEDRLTRLIAPWMFDPDLPLPIGHNELEVATIAAALEKMPGISRVLGLSFVHTYRSRGARGRATGRYGFKDSARGHDNDRRIGANFVRGATPASVFVPALRQGISFLPPRMGIGDLTIGRDLVAADPRQIDNYRKDPSELPYQIAPTGIGELRIGHDLIITAPDDAIPPSSELEIRPHPLDAVFLTK